MDELERVRRLVDQAPDPDPERKQAARDALLALAEAEESRLAEHPQPQLEQRPEPVPTTEREPEAGDGPAPVVAWLRRLLTPRWAPAAVAVGLVLVAVVGGALLRPWSDGEVGPADPPLAADPPATADQGPGAGQPDGPGTGDQGTGDQGTADQGTGDVEAGDASPPGVTGTDPELAGGCTDPNGLYTIGLADGWQTGPDGACQRFDQEPVELEAGIGGPDPLTPITAQVVDLAFGELTDPPPVDWDEVEGESTTIDGRPARRAVWVSTGEGAVEAGRTSYRYLVDLGDRTFVAQAHDPEDGTFDQLRDVLDRMMATIEFHGSG